jgi:hypothetical protein
MFYIFILLCLNSCFSCECDDELDDFYNIGIDSKSFDSSISINEILYKKNNKGEPELYTIQVIEPYNDTTYEFFRHSIRNQDTILWLQLRNPPQKVTILIPQIELNYVLTNFKIDGNISGDNCSCFLETSKTFVLNDSLKYEAINNDVVLRK